MFTGLVEQVGRVLAREDRGVAARLRVGCSFGAELELGESVAVNGVCLTVTSSSSSSFDADASAETLRLSTLAKLRPGAAVNLERATRANARLGGHVVLGHVDGIGSVEERIPVGAALDTRVAIPRALAPFVATKGSIAIDGVSLTLNEVEDRGDATLVRVMIIPHTQGATTLDSLKPGDAVNIEVDVLARYVFRQLSIARTGLVAEAAGAYEPTHGDGHAGAGRGETSDERITRALKRGGYA
ncbi:MAG: riboflavin synthase [Polyangiaceae bacterium]